MYTDESNKKIGGTLRAKIARESLAAIFKDKDNPNYLLKDIEYAKMFDVTRLTISTIRESLKVKNRTHRIIDRIDDLGPKDNTLKELSLKLGVKYQNLYKICSEYNISVLPDVRPIESLKEHAKNRSLETKRLIQESGILKDPNC